MYYPYDYEMSEWLTVTKEAVHNIITSSSKFTPKYN